MMLAAMDAPDSAVLANRIGSNTPSEVISRSSEKTVPPDRATVRE